MKPLEVSRKDMKYLITLSLQLLENQININDFPSKRLGYREIKNSVRKIKKKYNL